MVDGCFVCHKTEENDVVHWFLPFDYLVQEVYGKMCVPLLHSFFKVVIYAEHYTSLVCGTILQVKGFKLSHVSE